MWTRYEPESDGLTLLRDNPPVDAIEEPGGVIVGCGEDKEPVSVEFLNACSRKLTERDEVTVTLLQKRVV